ncbi:MAG: ATP-binding protein [Victivallales bacterium]
MKLKYKIFITLIVTSCLILVMTMGVLQFNIRKNFIEFLNEVEFAKQSRMMGLLRESFTRNQGWTDFRGNPEAWHRLLEQARPTDKNLAPAPPLPPTGEKRLPPPMPNDPGALHRHLCLFDADKNHVAGECRQKRQFNFHPIVLSGRTIGWLGLEHNEDMRTPIELAFLKKQTRAFYIIGCGILGLSLLISIIMSRHVLTPIRALAKGTRAMRRFAFDTQVHVNSNDELGALAADFNLMASTLKQYETMRKNWISDISHELRTPVAVILSKIEALQDGIRELTPELLDSLHRDILGLGRLINDLHRISLMDSENLSVSLKPVSLVSILNRTLDGFLIRFEQQGIEIRKVWEPDELPDIPGDAALLTRVFGNLLENTLKYTDSPGIMKLVCRVKGEKILVEVEDSPPGVPRDCLESIFERLYRVERSRNRSLGGSGLGLSMAREIISLHRGTITAADSSLGGLKIIIALPLKQIEVQ